MQSSYGNKDEQHLNKDLLSPLLMVFNAPAAIFQQMNASHKSRIVIIAFLEYLSSTLK